MRLKVVPPGGLLLGLEITRQEAEQVYFVLTTNYGEKYLLHAEYQANSECKVGRFMATPPKALTVTLVEVFVGGVCVWTDDWTRELDAAAYYEWGGVEVSDE